MKEKFTEDNSREDNFELDKTAAETGFLDQDVEDVDIGIQDKEGEDSDSSGSSETLLDAGYLNNLEENIELLKEGPMKAKEANDKYNEIHKALDKFKNQLVESLGVKNFQELLNVKKRKELNLPYKTIYLIEKAHELGATIILDRHKNKKSFETIQGAETIDHVGKARKKKI